MRAGRCVRSISADSPVSRGEDSFSPSPTASLPGSATAALSVRKAAYGKHWSSCIATSLGQCCPKSGCMTPPLDRWGSSSRHPGATGPRIGLCHRWTSCTAWHFYSAFGCTFVCRDRTFGRQVCGVDSCRLKGCYGSRRADRLDREESFGSPASPITVEWPLLKVERSVASQDYERPVAATAVIEQRNPTGCSQSEEAVPAGNPNDS